MKESDDIDIGVTISVCICTRDRPAELRRLLTSIPRSPQIVEVLVSDDGRKEADIEQVISEFPAVRWIQGPRKGVAANRNRVATAAVGTHVWFLDDDACPAPGCVEAFVSCIERHPAPARLIITGVISEFGRRVRPHEQTFLGHQGVTYARGQPITTVVLPNVVFPRTLFDELRFDERLRSVYEEVDFTTRAVAIGYEIACCCRAVADHSPPGTTGGEVRYGREYEVARIYITAKRRALTEKRYVQATLYLLVAIPHMIGGRLRRGGVSTLGGSIVGVWEILWRLVAVAVSREYRSFHRAMRVAAMRTEDRAHGEG